MASPGGINSLPYRKHRGNILTKSRSESLATVYSVTLLFTLGGVVTVLGRPGVGAGDTCGLVLGLPRATPPPLGHPPLPVAQLVNGLQQAPGLSSFAARLLLGYLHCHGEPHCVPSALPGSEETKARCSPKVWVYRAPLGRDESDKRSTGLQSLELLPD